MIGFYDSGMGGQRIADIFGIISDTPYIVYQDRSSLPLGDKTAEQIRDIVIAGVEKLFNQGCNLVILACNTASVTTIRYIQSTWLPKNYPNKQVLGVTVPLREYLDSCSEIKSQKGILLATQATIKTGFYQEYLAEAGYNIEYLACPNLAQAIEQDISKQDNNYTESARTLQNLSADIIHKPDYIILACTHYGYISKQIRNIFGAKQVLDPSQYIANRVLDYIHRHKI
jgi:glutamate racemase